MLRSSIAYTSNSSKYFRGCSLLFAFARTVLASVLAASTVTYAQGTPPLAVLTLAHSVVGSRITFVWVPNSQGSPATAYLLQAGSAPGLSNIALVQVPATQTSFVADAPAGTYYVRVVAVNGAGASSPSNEVVATVGGSSGGGGGCPVPAAPTGLSATTATPSFVTLRWTASAGATGYVLDVGSIPGATNIGSFSLGNTTILNSAAPAGTYFARLRALNGCGSSAPSAELTFTVVNGVQGSLPAGVYSGTMANSQRAGLGRSPITAFTLTLNQATPPTFSLISARWQDNAGCVKTNFIYGGISNGRLHIDVETLTCNDGDLLLNITSINGNVVSGTCNGGPNCTFQMIKQ